jgi:hypothetical protein
MEINSKEPALRDAPADRKNLRDQKVILIRSWPHVQAQRLYHRRAPPWRQQQAAYLQSI